MHPSCCNGMLWHQFHMATEDFAETPFSMLGRQKCSTEVIITLEQIFPTFRSPRREEGGGEFSKSPGGSDPISKLGTFLLSPYNLVSFKKCHSALSGTSMCLQRIWGFISQPPVSWDAPGTSSQARGQHWANPGCGQESNPSSWRDTIKPKRMKRLLLVCPMPVNFLG